MNRYSFLALPCVAFLTAACTGGGTTQFSAELVDIGAGRRMYVECDGAGAPTVLLVSGKGNRADTWSVNRTDPGNPEATVFRQVARFTRVCAYDRPSTVGGNGERAAAIRRPSP